MFGLHCATCHRDVNMFCRYCGIEIAQSELRAHMKICTRSSSKQRIGASSEQRHIPDGELLVFFALFDLMVDFVCL